GGVQSALGFRRLLNPIAIVVVVLGKKKQAQQAQGSRCKKPLHGTLPLLITVANPKQIQKLTFGTRKRASSSGRAAIRPGEMSFSAMQGYGAWTASSGSNSGFHESSSETHWSNSCQLDFISGTWSRPWPSEQTSSVPHQPRNR